jgi:hypothetical protein
MKKKPTNILPVRSDVKVLTYHRNPTAGEIRFGHGAIHYRDFPVAQCLKKDGSVKKRLKADDGLIYTR